VSVCSVQPDCKEALEMFDSKRHTMQIPPEAKLRQAMARLFHLVRCNRHEELNSALTEDHNRDLVNVRIAYPPR
jgi:hypothetical protein